MLAASCRTRTANMICIDRRALIAACSKNIGSPLPWRQPGAGELITFNWIQCVKQIHGAPREIRT